MEKKISKRCGKNTCQFYDKNNKVSACTKFDDRNNCSLSLRHRKKMSQKSIERSKLINGN